MCAKTLESLAAAMRSLDSFMHKVPTLQDRHSQRGSSDTIMLGTVRQVNGMRQQTSCVHGCSRRHCELRAPTPVRRFPSTIQRTIGPSWCNNCWREGRPTCVARVCTRRISGTPIKTMLPNLRVQANTSHVTRHELSTCHLHMCISSRGSSRIVFKCA